jgi:hypothetical protein
MRGYDIFFEEPREIRERYCKVCGTLCEVKRNQTGPTGWVEAMARRARLHDFFYCPHSKKEWHKQALKIVLAIEETPSKRVAALMHQDLLDLLAEHGIHPDLSLQE